ncbi:MAG: acyl-CoA dehydrogenase family protein, partial [Candidatus Binatia bacterium]
MSEAAPLLAALERVSETALDHARRLTDGGKRIDDFQVHCERVAYLATELHAVRALADYASAAGKDGDPLAPETATIFAAEVAARARHLVSSHLEDFGFDEKLLAATLDAPDVRRLVRAGASEKRVRELGKRVISSGGWNRSWLENEME